MYCTDCKQDQIEIKNVKMYKLCLFCFVKSICECDDMCAKCECT